MNSFFEKLQKGMGIKNIPKAQQSSPERNSDEQEKPIKKEGEAEKKEDFSFKPLKTKQKPKKVKEEKKPAAVEREENKEVKKKIEIKPILAKIPADKKEKETEVKEETTQEIAQSNLEPGADEGTKKWLESEGQLVVDVYQTNGEIVIQSAIAGVKPQELEISVENDVVTIKGERKKTMEKEEKNYFYQECYWGRFSREIILPAEVDASRTEAAIKDGILTIRIPKIEKEKKKVNIKEE